jgi:hypothetical protein
MKLFWWTKEAFNNLLHTLNKLNVSENLQKTKHNFKMAESNSCKSTQTEITKENYKLKCSNEYVKRWHLQNIEVVYVCMYV